MRLSEIGWQLFFSQTFHREPTGWNVDPIYIPNTLETPIIRIYCSSETARSSWRAAGELIQTIGNSRNPDFEGQSVAVPLNVIKLIEFGPTVTDYSLKFFPKPWIDSFKLEIESPAN
jgi:hypothetical protein